MDEIEVALQGTWNLPDDGGSFTFNAGALTISGQGNMLSGTYEIQTSKKEIKGKLSTSDNSVTIHLPYTYEDGTLHVYNNRNVEMKKEK